MHIYQHTLQNNFCALFKLLLKCIITIYRSRIWMFST